MEVIECNFLKNLALVEGFKIHNKILSDMPFLFNSVDFYVANTNSKPWICAREVYEKLKYSKKV